jgi:hypothetical protein
MPAPARWLVLAAVLAAPPAQAQPRLDAPPRLPPAAAEPAPAARAAVARSPIHLPGAAPPPAREATRPDAPDTEPPDDALLPPARRLAPETRIEQIRQGNRIVEIVVTPAGSTSSYVIVNREGRPPLSNQELSSGLSTPRFFRFDF